MATEVKTLSSDPIAIDVTEMGLRIQSDGSVFKWAENATKPTTAARHICIKDRDVFINGPRKIWLWCDGSMTVSVT